MDSVVLVRETANVSDEIEDFGEREIAASGTLLFKKDECRIDFVLGEFFTRWDVWRGPDQFGETQSSSSHSGENSSPFQDGAAALKLIVLDPAESSFPCAMKFFDLPS